MPALQRAVCILDLIAQKGSCSVVEICEALDIPKSSVYLLLDELKRCRFVTQDIHGNYCLWLKLVELSEYALNSLDIRDLVKPMLTQLMEETGLLCHLGIIDGMNAYYILKIESHSTISVRSFEGKRLSLSRSGIGKCLLAWQSEERRAELLSHMSYEKKTPTSITSSDALKQEIELIRQRGWSFDNGEDYLDVRCVAVPVFNAKNELAAAISLVGTSLQVTDKVLPELVQKGVLCAQDISRKLGWRGVTP